jgi:uncharacterized 2Fe-2S/4Fe-4S cluster protein (DUF4445 family)
MQIGITGTGEKSIKTLLAEKGVSLYAPCAGRGTCGQCVVIVKSGECPPSEADNERFTGKELEQGFRLACRAFPKGDICIEVPEQENPVICTEYSDENTRMPGSVSSTTDESAAGLRVGIDLGTTTIVLTTLGSDGTPGETRAFLNPLSAYGADVVSRLEAAAGGHLLEMKVLLRNTIEKELKSLASSLTGDSVSLRISTIALAGNTVMTHILMGWDVSGLGKYPFKPYSLDTAQTELLGIPVTVFPGISAFVGGDIVAGIYGLDLMNGSVGDMLMDLGTNGEMVLVTEKGMIASSASAGPALEGAHISCGTGCVEGAVTGITLENLRPVLNVAGSKTHVGKGLAGACGSAILELVDELLRTGILKPDGSFIKSYVDEGFAFGTDRNGRVLALTQADVRELQLAKGAVSTAALMLCEKGNVEPDKLRISLAGGMGSGLRPERIRRTGLIPVGSQVRAVGNSVLCGLMRFLRESDDPSANAASVQALSDIAGSVTVYDLALDEGFQERFLDSLNFSS